MTFRIRPLGEHDIAAVLCIQAETYPQQLLESAETIRQRLHNFPDLAMVAEDEAGVCAYLFGYRASTSMAMPLDGALVETDPVDSLYIHDLAVSARAAGRGIGPALLAHLLDEGCSDHLPHMAPPSDQNSADFWSPLSHQDDTEQHQPQRCNPESCGASANCRIKTLH